MKHRATTWGLVLLLVFPMVAAWAGGKPEAAAPESALPPVKITGYLLGSPPAGFSAMMEELNRRLKRDLNVTMVINHINWGDLQAKYPLVLAAGEDVDWIYTANWAYYFQEAAKGAFYELKEDLLKKYMPRHYAALPKIALDQARLRDGKIYMIPTATPDRKVPVTVIRADLRKKYNVPPIKQPADLEAYLRAIKANEPSMIPMYMDSQYDIGRPFADLFNISGPRTTDVLYATGAGTGLYWLLNDKSGKLYYIAEEPLLSRARPAALTMKRWYDAGYLNKDVFANKVRSKESFVQGKSAVGFGNSIDIQGTVAAAIDNGWEVEIIPALDANGHYLADPYLNNGVALAATTRNPERTLQVLDLIMEEKSYNFLVYFGVEGVNYVIRDGKVALPPGVTADKNTYPPDVAGFWFTNKDQFPPLANWSPGYVQHRKDIVEKGYLVDHPLSAFSAQVNEIKTEVANVSQTIVQYLQPINIGVVPDVDKAFATLDEKLKAAGIERVRSVLQAQINEYLKAF